MSLKDKLNSIKKRNDSLKKAPKLAKDELDNLADVANTKLNQVTDSLDITTEHKAIDETASNAKKPLFGKKNKLNKTKATKTKAPKGISRARTPKSNQTKLKSSIIGLALLLLGLLGAAAYLFLQGDKASTTPTPVANKPTQASPNTKPAVVPQSTHPDTQNNQVPVDASVTDTDIQPPLVDAELIPEAINEPIPEDKIVAAEELDALQDERDRLSSQENKLKKELEDKEKLVDLKDDLIALKMKQIEALETKMKNEPANP